MRYAPTPSNGRIAEGRTPFGSYRVEWDAAGGLISAWCNPTPFEPPPVAKRPPGAKGGGCGGCEDQPSRSVGDMVRGVVGLAKAELGMDAATPEVIAARKEVCLACRPHYDFGVCSACGCYLAAKVKIASEKCPDGKW